MMSSLLFTAALSSQLVTAVVDRIPNLDVKLSCSQSRIKLCITHEQMAREQLQSAWQGATKRVRASCAKEVKHSGHASYVIWLICLRRHKGQQTTS